jgi:integrase
MSKARNGDGSLWHDEVSDKWKIEISLPVGPGGKRRRTRRTFATKTQAKEGLRRLVAERDAGRLTEIRHETVAAYGIAWVRNVKALHVRPGTASDYEYRLRHNISPYLGSIKITELTTDAVEEWLATMRRGGKSAATINGARQVLMAVCKHALRNRVIPFNPVEPTSPVRRQPNDPTQVRQAWNLEEITHVLDCARDNDDLDAFLHLMLHLGLRPGEALALRWRDITADKTSLWVNGTLKEERRLLPNGQGADRVSHSEPSTPWSRHAHELLDLYTAFFVRRARQSASNECFQDSLVPGGSGALWDC